MRDNQLITHGNGINYCIILIGMVVDPDNPVSGQPLIWA